MDVKSSEVTSILLFDILLLQFKVAFVESLALLKRLLREDVVELVNDLVELTSPGRYQGKNRQKVEQQQLVDLQLQRVLLLSLGLVQFLRRVQSCRRSREALEETWSLLYFLSPRLWALLDCLKALHDPVW